MSEVSANEQCLHIGCVCAAPAGENYCSPHCEGTPYEERCDCGHADCQTETSVSQTV
jgi:hypothetical protein